MSWSWPPPLTLLPPAPWYRRIMQSLLYGREIDRARKTQARLGLAMMGFAIIYGVIAVRLVVYAMATEGHTGRRIGSPDAVGTARPDLVDRNGEILATDFKIPVPVCRTEANHRSRRGDSSCWPA